MAAHGMHGLQHLWTGLPRAILSMTACLSWSNPVQVWAHSSECCAACRRVMIQAGSWTWCWTATRSWSRCHSCGHTKRCCEPLSWVPAGCPSWGTTCVPSRCLDVLLCACTCCPRIQCVCCVHHPERMRHRHPIQCTQSRRCHCSLAALYLLPRVHNYTRPNCTFVDLQTIPSTDSAWVRLLLWATAMLTQTGSIEA